MQDAQEKKRTLEALRRTLGARGADIPPRAGSESASGRVPDLGPLVRSGFHECLGRTAGDHAAVLGFALTCAGFVHEATGKPVLYAALAGERQETGRLHAPGLAAHGLAPADLLHVAVQSEKELYWVAEEALGSAAPGAVLLCAGSRERLYDFTISRRLKLRTETASLPLFLVRSWRAEGATAATARWRLSRLPSAPDPLTVPRQPLIGAARFNLRIERSPLFRHQSWELEYDASGGFRLAAPLADGPARERAQPARSRAA